MFDEGRVLENNLSYFFYLYSKRNLSFIFIAAFDFWYNMIRYTLWKAYNRESIQYSELTLVVRAISSQYNLIDDLLPHMAAFAVSTENLPHPVRVVTHTHECVRNTLCTGHQEVENADQLPVIYQGTTRVAVAGANVLLTEDADLTSPHFYVIVAGKTRLAFFTCYMLLLHAL